MFRFLSRRAWGGTAALVVLAAPGCKSSETRKTEAARATVQRFFEALPSGDCARLGPLLVEELAAGCQEAVEELQSHGLSLLEVQEVRVDGRDPNAVLVRAKVAWDGKVREQPFLLRVEKHPDGWKLRL